MDRIGHVNVYPVTREVKSKVCCNEESSTGGSGIGPVLVVWREKKEERFHHMVPKQAHISHYKIRLCFRIVMKLMKK